MKKLRYKIFFSKYKESISDKLARFSYSLYKNTRLTLKNIIPLSENEKYTFEDHWLHDSCSTDMPCGFDYKSKSQEKGYINLEFVDFIDYLPKEDLDSFKKCINKFVLYNKSAKYGPCYTSKDYDRIDNMGRYIDRYAFSNLNVVCLKHNAFLEHYTSQIAISLCNLSSSFVVVRYRFYISKEFQDKYNEICQKKYPPYSDVSRSFDTPWYKPKHFGKAFYTGDNAREKEQYILLNNFKWKAVQELSRYFTIHFMNDQFFPPTFETYSTNIRPNNAKENMKFWNSYMLDHYADYAPEYNLCVGWDNHCGKNEGLRMMAYCGGNFSSDDSMPEIAKHDIIHSYEIYLAAISLRNIAERDIAICNKKISKAIKRKKAATILKTRIHVEQKLYYSYRFISEFTGDTIDNSDIHAFKNPHFKGKSNIELNLESISQNINDTKQQIDIILKNLNNAAEYINTKSNLSLQWFMMVITMLSLLIATISLLNSDMNDIKSILDSFIDLIKNIDIL